MACLDGDNECFMHRRVSFFVVMIVAFAIFSLFGGGRVVPKDSRSLSLEHAVGQMLMVGFRGYVVDDEVDEMLDTVRPGGVVLFDRDPLDGEEGKNIQSPKQVRFLTRSLQRRSSVPLFVSVDSEGGRVNRLKERYGFSVSVPSARELGSGPVSNTSMIARDLAKQIAWSGINWNLAPVVDVDVDPASPAIGAFERSFSADASVVVEHASAFVDSFRSVGVLTTLKHFPGHGSASGDTHLGVVDVTHTYRVRELDPYRAFVSAGYDGPIMTAHIVNRTLDPSGVPATLSSAIVTGLLREEIGFTGIIVSDDMQMGAIVEVYGLEDAVVRAVVAGVDMIFLGNQIGDYDIDSVYRVRDALVRAVHDGVISEDQIYSSVDRILNAKRQVRVW